MGTIFTFIETISMIMIYCIAFLGAKDKIIKYLLNGLVISIMSTGLFFIINKI